MAMSFRTYCLGVLVLSVCILGCSDAKLASNDVATESTTPAIFNASGAPTVEFSVPDMMCPEGCGEKTKEILSELPGAKEVVINFDARTATVAIEEGKFDSDAAIATLKDYGFENSSLKADASPAEAAAQDSPSS